MDENAQKAIVKSALIEVFGFENEEQAAQFRVVMPTLIVMAEDWKAALKFGKWLTGAATFISIVFAIWQAVKDIFKHQ